MSSQAEEPRCCSSLRAAKQTTRRWTLQTWYRAGLPSFSLVREGAAV